MRTRRIQQHYQSRFSKPSAQSRALNLWAMPDDLCPTHERYTRLMTAIRRLPGNHHQTLVQARDESARITREIGARDWKKWRRVGWANGMEVRDA